MKIKDITPEKPKEFQPITLEITIESREELEMLHARLNITARVLPKVAVDRAKRTNIKELLEEIEDNLGDITR